MNNLPSDLAYAACGIDGEGSIFITKRKNSRCRHHFRHEPGVIVVNTKEPFVRWFEEHFGGSVSLEKYANKKHNSCWRWTLVGKGITPFLLSILPYLLLKKGQAKIVLKFCEHLQHNSYSRSILTEEEFAFREDLYHLSQKLNERGEQTGD